MLDHPLRYEPAPLADVPDDLEFALTQAWASANWWRVYRAADGWYTVSPFGAARHDERYGAASLDEARRVPLQVVYADDPEVVPYEDWFDRLEVPALTRSEDLPEHLDRLRAGHVSPHVSAVDGERELRWVVYRYGGRYFIAQTWTCPRHGDVRYSAVPAADRFAAQQTGALYLARGRCW